MTATLLDPASPGHPAVTARCAALPLICTACGARFDPEPSAICQDCLGPLVPEYAPGRSLPDRETIASRAPSLWRYREWLPFAGTPTLSPDSGWDRASGEAPPPLPPEVIERTRSRYVEAYELLTGQTF